MGSNPASPAKNPAGPLAGLAGFLENAGFEPERVRDKFRLRSTCSVKKPDRASCGAARRAPHACVWEFEPAAFRRNAGRSRQPSHVGAKSALRPRHFLPTAQKAAGCVAPLLLLPAKSHAAPPLFACKRAHNALACYQLFAGWCYGHLPVSFFIA